MKKLLVLLALLLALTMVFVACKDSQDPTDTTVADQPTEEPTQDVEDPTAAPSDSEDTTEEPTEAPTAEPEVPTAEPEVPTNAPETPTEEPETADPMDPVNVFDAEDIQTVTGGDPNNMTQDCLTLEDGYIHVVPIGPDPYWYPFAGVDGARYVAIRYRTDATGADIQMYIGSTGGGPSDDSSMLRQPVVADSEWHLAIFDTQSLIDAEIYDGKYVSYFRFDALEAGYILDENGQPYKPDGTNYARYTLPEGCSIDVAYIGFFHSEDAALTYDFEQYKAPMWDADKSVVVHQNFDQFFKGAGTADEAVNNNLNYYHAVQIPNWDKVATLPDFSVETLSYWGWMALAAETVGTFGYQIDMGDPIYDESFTFTPEQGVIDAALDLGGKAGTRMLIRINIAGLDGTHTVRVLYKDVEGNEVCLNEITVILPEKPKDITDSFVSDIDSNEIGTSIDASDLSNFFIAELPLGGCSVEANGEGKVYTQSSISDFYADVNGRYFFKANVVDSNGAGWMFVRGYKVVNSDAVIAAFNPDAGIYKINNYYETDNAGAMGGAGIYARLQGGKLFIMVKYYNAETVTRVGNKLYAIDAAGSELTMADDGYNVSIMVDGVTYATIELIDSVDYEDIKEIAPAGSFAAKAVVTLKDGTTETIENTLIAATCQCQIGVVARSGIFKFDAISVGGYSTIEVPALEIVVPEEPEPVDPDAPVLVLDPEYINELAGSTEQTVAQHIGSHEIITEDGVTFVRLTSNGGDPYVAIVKLGSYLELPPYMAFAYRTNCDLDAHIFIGSGQGWSGQGDVTSVAWNEDNNWNLAVLDLNNSGLTSIQNGVVSYCRFDFFTGNGNGNMDVEYVAFFNSAEAAEKYFNNLHPVEEPVPTTPEEIVNAAYGLAEGEALDGTYTLTGVITSVDEAYNADYSNITVTIVVGDMTDKPIKCYRMTGDGVDALKKGDTITVTGTLKNYYGTVEFDFGCTASDIIAGPEIETEEPDENANIIDFSTADQRTEIDTSKQVWTNGNFTMTNNKGDSSTDVADYTNPVRIYKNSEVVFSCAGMVKLVIESDSNAKNFGYLKDSLTAAAVEYTVDGYLVTIEFATPVDTFTLVASAGQIRFKTVTAYVAPADEPAANEINVTITDNNCWVDTVEFTAAASGTYTFYLPAGMGAWDQNECDTNWTSSPYVDYYANTEGATFSIELEEGATTIFYIASATKGDAVITWTFTEGEVGGGEEPEDPEEVEIVELVLGENTVVVTEDQYTAGGFTTTFTVTEEGNYSFTSNDLLVRIVTDMGLSTGTVYLTAGTYEIQIVTAYLSGAGTYGVTVTFTAPEEPDPEEPIEPSVEDGSPANPYVLTELNTEISFDEAHDVYYTYTTESLIKMEITYTEGCCVSISGDGVEWDKDEGGMMYIVMVPEGATVTLNTWSTTGGGTYVITGGGK